MSPDGKQGPFARPRESLIVLFRGTEASLLMLRTEIRGAPGSFRRRLLMLFGVFRKGGLLGDGRRLSRCLDTLVRSLEMLVRFTVGLGFMTLVLP